MSLGKYLCILIAAMLLCTVSLAAFNAVIDPFGLFGDKLLNWWSYNMTQNPRTAKISWLDRCREDYDAYIIGCSKTGSLPVELLNKHYGARFFNMTMYGGDLHSGDLYNIEMTARYLLSKHGAKHIVVSIGFAELLAYSDEGSVPHARVDGTNLTKFYAGYLLANPRYALEKLAAYRKASHLNPNRIFDVATGAYDNAIRDTEPIGALDEYLQKHPSFTWELKKHSALPAVDACVESIARIKDMCCEAGSTFTFMISPMFRSELDTFPQDCLEDFYRKVAAVTDFWDFSGYHSVASEPRYFYDIYHHRNAVGVMALARMSGDTSVYVPKDFGLYVTKENIETRLEQYFQGPAAYTKRNDRKVPVLMYHSISDGEPKDFRVSAKTFDSQLKALKDAGYETITFARLIDFVERGTPLPEKPLIITFDDGYANVVTIAAPLLARHSMCAAANVIGVSVGKDTYKDTGRPITPHFSLEDAAPWVKAGVLEIQSHSFDMHRIKELDTTDYREGVYPKPGESEEQYIAAFRADVQASCKLIEDALGTPVLAYTYPYGLYTDLTEVLLWEMGIKTTVSVVGGVNTVIRGLPQSLRALKRCGVGEHTSPAELVRYLDTLMTDD